MIDKKFAYEVGSYIRNRRMDLNLTQQELSNIVDMSVAHISCIERGEKIPGLVILIKIMNALQIDFNEMFSDYLTIDKAPLDDYENLSKLAKKVSPECVKLMIGLMEEIVYKK